MSIYHFPVRGWFLSDPLVKLYAGGPLSKTSGDKLVAHGVHLVVGYGATEVGTTIADFSVYDADKDNRGADKLPEEWEWLSIDHVSKPRWVDQGDGTYELQYLVSDALSQRYSH